MYTSIYVIHVYITKQPYNSLIPCTAGHDRSKETHFTSRYALSICTSRYLTSRCLWNVLQSETYYIHICHKRAIQSFIPSAAANKRSKEPHCTSRHALSMCFWNVLHSEIYYINIGNKRAIQSPHFVCRRKQQVKRAPFHIAIGPIYLSLKRITLKHII